MAKTKKKTRTVKKSDVKIGGLYVAKVGGQLTIVEIKEEAKPDGKKFGGWLARNLITWKPVHIKSQQRLKLNVTRVLQNGDPVVHPSFTRALADILGCDHDPTKMIGRAQELMHNISAKEPGCQEDSSPSQHS